MPSRVETTTWCSQHLYMQVPQSEAHGSPRARSQLQPTLYRLQQRRLAGQNSGNGRAQLVLFVGSPKATYIVEDALLHAIEALYFACNHEVRHRQETTHTQHLLHLF